MPAKAPEQQPLLAMSETPEEIKQAVAPKETLLNTTVSANGSITAVAPQQMVTQDQSKSQVIAQVPATEQTSKPVKKHGIRNFGDMVNLVIAKVDKRKDKVIEFSDTDDGDSITGINLGVIKIKKEK